MDRKNFISIVIIVVIIMVGASPNFAELPMENGTDEIIKIVCETLEKSIKETYKGIGTAKVLIHKEGLSPAEIIEDYDTGETAIIKPRGTEIETTEQKFLADFAFKGEKSLAERYEIRENRECGKLLSATINTKEISFHYDRSLGFAVRVPTKSFNAHYREQGYDFHPETLTIMFTGGLPLIEQIKMFFEVTKLSRIDYTDNNLLSMKFEGIKDYPEMLASAVLVLDPQANFRPVECKTTTKDKKWGISTDYYQAKWKQYSSTWYITDLKYEEKSARPEELPTNYRVEIEVLSFDHDTEVKDSKFDFENLPIPKGTPVYDHIEGIDYKWGEELEEFEDQTEETPTSQK